MKYIEKTYGGNYLYKANHKKLTEILLDNNISVKFQGDSCYADRNFCIIYDLNNKEILQNIEEEYIKYLKDKFIKSLKEVPNTSGVFYTRKQFLYEAHGHAEPISRPENFIPIRLPNFNGGDPQNYREIGYIDIDKITIKHHLNIKLPDKWYKFECIGHGGSVVNSAQKRISDIVGFQVCIHYY